MSSVLNLLPNAVGQKPTPVVYGEVATGQPAPTSFADSLKVVIPDWNPEVYFAIDDWPAVHGTTLPAQGAPCLLEYDNQGELRCTWWKGSTVFTGASSFGFILFGDGSDGAVTLDGVATFPFATKSGSAYTLTRDVYATTFVINAGVTLNRGGSLRVFARVSYTNAGTDQNNGSNAAGTIGGVGAPAGAPSLGASHEQSGQDAGVNGVPGNASPGFDLAYGGAGGAGGNTQGEVGGDVAALTNRALWRDYRAIVELFGVTQSSLRAIAGGQGGASGAAAAFGTSAGGGGGGAGGLVAIISPSITNPGTIQANGGNGGNGAQIGSAAGGGGGGGGGAILLTFASYTNAGTVQTLGGAAGLHAGTLGADGTAGSAGSTYQLAA